MIKKLAILFATLAMVLCCTTTAFAAGTGTITVENPQSGQTYTAYKIFDTTKKTVGSDDTYVYTIDSVNNKWFSIVNTYANTAENGLILTKQGESNIYYVEVDTNKFSATKFAEHLKTNGIPEGATGTQLETTGASKPTASNLDLGYYFVNSTSGTICNLTTTKPSVTIYDKNEKPEITKEQKNDAGTKIEGSVQVGDTIHYEITGKVPSTTGYDTYTYKITDTMSNGLTFNKDVKVSIDGTDVTNAADVTINYTPDNTNATGFELTIPVKNYQNKIGATISVKYTATVNKDAVATVSKNTAKLEYSNDPKNPTQTTPTTEIEKKVYTAKIVVDKVEKGSDATKLANAQFVLYKKDTATNKVTYYKLTTTAGTNEAKVEWTENFADATVAKTGTNGAAEFIGLPNGTYYLKETKAPDGYNVLTKDVEITIAGDENDTTTLTYTQKVENNKGALLPETGGIGTIGLTALAVAVVACALFLPKKKNRA